MPYRLGVDLGTTFTAAAVTDGSEPTVIGLGNRALQIPSVLFLKSDGEFLVGEAAERRGLTEPDRLAREFKRRIGDHVPIMVAGAPFSPQALTSHLLRWVVDSVTEQMGESPNEVVLTHPANWGPFRLELLDQVAVMAGIGPARRCTEPEAAAAQYAAQTRVAPGDKVAVYDLGGGTFDACVLEKTETAFRGLGAPEGVEHLGGIDFDEAVLRHVLTALNAASESLDPDDPAVTVGLARLRRDCVEAKEALSVDVDTLVPVALPGLSTTVRVTRAEFELMIRPELAETIAAMGRALRSAHVEPSELHSILLVGGSSRIPLVSEMLHREFSVPTALDTHPKHDVALGSVRFGHDESDVITAPPPQAHPIEPRPIDTSVTVSTSEAAVEAPLAAQLPRAVRPSAGAPRGVAREPAHTTPSPTAEPAAGAAPFTGTGPAMGADGERDRTPAPRPDGAASGAGPTGPPMEPAAGRPPPSGGLVRLLAVVVAVLLLGVGIGVVIALRDQRGSVAGPPSTSVRPSSSPVTPSVVTPTASFTATLSPTPDPLSSQSASEASTKAKAEARRKAAARARSKGSSASFEHFKVTVSQISRHGSQVHLQAKVCVKSLPPDPQGDRTRISWEPWSIRTGSRTIGPDDQSPALEDGFPVKATYRVGQCASGWIPFATNRTVTQIVYANFVGDRAVWDPDNLAAPPTTRPGTG